VLALEASRGDGDEPLTPRPTSSGDDPFEREPPELRAFLK
jgi:hypothetical protein